MSWRACYTAPSTPEAHLVRGYLEQRGVPCVLRSQLASPYPGISWGRGVQVLVPEEWLRVAQKFIERPAPTRRRAARDHVVGLPARKAAS